MQIYPEKTIAAGASRRERRRAISRDIQKRGVILVHRDFGPALGGGYTYTAGLTALRLPELLMTGVREQTATDLLSELTSHHRSAPWQPGDVWAVPERHRAYPEAVFRVTPVRAAHPFACDALALLYPDEFRLLQVVWPDEEGAYPGEAAWKDSDGMHQPLLQPDDRDVPFGRLGWKEGESAGCRSFSGGSSSVPGVPCEPRPSR